MADSHGSSKGYSFVEIDPDRETKRRLAAAAPDMLIALENLVNSFEKHRPKEYWDAARAAIAKARGGE